jgi:Ca-activated chloride channel family protein
MELQQLYVTVTDEQGQRVLDLGDGAFTILDEGHRQVLTTFARGDIPFTAVLLLDASASMQGEKLTAALAGASSFVLGMEELDLVRILAFSDRLVNSTPFTGVKDLLVTGLEGTQAQGGTALYDHLWAAVKLLEPRQGRRVVVFLSDGIDTHSVLTMDQVYERARRSQTLLYWIRLSRHAGDAAPDDRGSNLSSSWRDAEAYRRQFELLQRAVDESGGRTVVVADPSEIAPVFVEVLRELREQYVLGYYPSDQDDDGRWHDVKVKVNGSTRGLEVRTHEGYVDL